MSQTVSRNQNISDQCRFLLMEMGIGILNQKMTQIISHLMEQFPGLSEGGERSYRDAVVKGMYEIYQSQLIRSILDNLTEAPQMNRIEQLLLLDQLNFGFAIKEANINVPEAFNIRECLKYMPAFQAKVQCFGLMSNDNSHCLPIHPWLWRKHFNHHNQYDVIPCLHHRKHWHASTDIFYLQDQAGEVLSFKDELSVEDCQQLNHLINRLSLDFPCYFLDTTATQTFPIHHSQPLKVNLLKSPFDYLDEDSYLIPYQSIKLSSFVNYEQISTKDIAELIFTPLQQLNNHGVDLSFYHMNPLLIIKNNQLAGVIYRHMKSVQYHTTG